MKHLISMIKPIPVKRRNNGTLNFNHPLTKFIIYKMGGFWCRFSQNSWANHLGICKATFSSEIRKGVTMDEIIAKPRKRITTG